MDNKMNYQKALKKSTNKKIIKIGDKNYVLNKERFRQFKLKMVAITASVVMTITAFNLVKDDVKFAFMKDNISLEVAGQMIENNYQSFPGIDDGKWDYRYERLDSIDPFSLLVYMGAPDAESVIQYRGFENWDDYAKSEGYENKDEWYQAQKKLVVNQKNKSRSK